MTITTQRLGARDADGRIVRCGSVTRTDGGSWGVTLHMRPGLSDPFPIGRRGPPPSPNEAPRRWRPSR